MEACYYLAVFLIDIRLHSAPPLQSLLRLIPKVDLETHGILNLAAQEVQAIVGDRARNESWESWTSKL